MARHVQTQRDTFAWKLAMPTYYHRSVTPHEDKKPAYFYTTESGDPHDVDWETRAYGDHVYQTELPEFGRYFLK